MFVNEMEKVIRPIIMFFLTFLLYVDWFVPYCVASFCSL